MKKVKLTEVIEELRLEVIRKSSNIESIELTNAEVNRPGLQLTGFMEEFPYRRIQLLGKAELAYFVAMDEELRYERMRGILSYDIPCLIISHNADMPKDVIDLADYYNRTLLRSDKSTTRLISNLGELLEYKLSEEETVHASLLEIYGMGVLITGESSVGKSETGLDLVTRGHRLVADDVVEIKSLDKGLLAQAPENIRHFLEIRGLGILDIRRLYGLGSVKPDTYIDLVVHLEKWNDEKEYDRIGLDDEKRNLLGVDIPYITIPVKPGRNIAMIIEVAVLNQRQKALGYNAAVELNNRLIEEMKRNANS